MILGQHIKTEQGWGRIETIGDCPFADFRAGTYYYVVSIDDGWADWMSEAKLEYSYLKPHAQKFYATLFESTATGELLDIVFAAIGNNDNLALAATQILCERLQWETEEFCQQEIVNRLSWNRNPLTNRIYEIAAGNTKVEYCDDCDTWFFDTFDFDAHLDHWPGNFDQPGEWYCPGYRGYSDQAYDETKENRMEGI